MNKKKLKKYSNWILIALTIIIISVFIVLIYIKMFMDGESNRLEGIENYKVTTDEINLVKDKLNELETIQSIDISTNYKIIKIFIKLEEDINIENLTEVITESISNFSDNNLAFYDIEIFVDSLDENSEIYPKIGYKHKSNSKFTWNR